MRTTSLTAGLMLVFAANQTGQTLTVPSHGLTGRG
jgi:hypothetical protein